MDKTLRLKMTEKMAEIARQEPQMRQMAGRLDSGGAESFLAGMAAGRLYNSFVYQSRRIQGRDPTDEEVDELIGMASGWSGLRRS